jgi:hypothetical protein
MMVEYEGGLGGMGREGRMEKGVLRGGLIVWDLMCWGSSGACILGFSLVGRLSHNEGFFVCEIMLFAIGRSRGKCAVNISEGSG